MSEKEKKITSRTKLQVLIACRSDKTGRSFVVGDQVSSKDFPIRVLQAWVEDTVPPVLEIVSDGRNSDGKK